MKIMTRLMAAILLVACAIARGATGGAFSLPSCTAITSISESGTTCTALTASTTGISVGTVIAVAGVTPVQYDGIVTVTAVTSNTSFVYTNPTGTSGLANGSASTDTSFGSQMVWAVPKTIFNASSPQFSQTGYSLQNTDSANHAEFLNPYLHPDEPFDLPPGSAVTFTMQQNSLTILYGFSSSTSAAVVVCGGVVAR